MIARKSTTSRVQSLGHGVALHVKARPAARKATKDSYKPSASQMQTQALTDTSSEGESSDSSVARRLAGPSASKRIKRDDSEEDDSDEEDDRDHSERQRAANGAKHKGRNGKATQLLSRPDSDEEGEQDTTIRASQAPKQPAQPRKYIQTARKSVKSGHKPRSTPASSPRKQVTDDLVVTAFEEDGDDATLHPGQAVYVILDDRDAKKKTLDEDRLGIALIHQRTGAAQKDRSTRRVRWLYRHVDIGTAPKGFQARYDKIIDKVRGDWELVHSEHYDTVPTKSLADPPIVFRFRDDAVDADDALELLSNPDNHNEADLHALNVGIASYYWRSGWGKFDDRQAGARKLELPKHCKCNKPYNPKQVMRRCADCVRWYHVECMSSANRSPSSPVVIRGREYGIVGNFALADDDDDSAPSWRRSDTVPDDQKQLLGKFAAAQRSVGKNCPECRAVI